MPFGPKGDSNIHRPSAKICKVLLKCTGDGSVLRWRVAGTFHVGSYWKLVILSQCGITLLFSGISGLSLKIKYRDSMKKSVNR